jgi:putative iron-regulated protein
MKKNNLLLLLVISFLILSCKKEPVANQPVPASSADLNEEILTSFSTNITQATYNDLADKANQFYVSVQTFSTTSTDVSLTECKQLWKDTRSAWEQSEAFLFGPVESGNYDPRIDTWPVNYTDLDSILASSVVFSDNYINGLEDALRGFHPIEYLLFGHNGNKTASQFTNREKEYLIALVNDVKNITTVLSQSWNTSVTGNYAVQFTTAGQTGSLYATKRGAFEEVVNAMIAICDEVANGKIEEPFAAQNPALEESPFSFNSTTDFINNIKSVQNVYLGKYIADGKGLEDFVRANNLSLDSTIKNKINSAIAALNNITLPFGQAIISQPVQVTNAQTAINSLKETLENDLFTLVHTHIN